MDQKDESLGIQPQPVKKSLRYDFTATEIHEMSLLLASKTKERNTVEESKKAAASQFKATIEPMTNDDHNLFNAIQ